LLKRAIAKYGIENFSKQILHVFDNESDMNAKEKELVVIFEQSYNLCPGGKGGFGYINERNLRASVDVLNAGRLQKMQSNSDFRQIMVNASKKGNQARQQWIKSLTPEQRRYYFGTGSFKNKKHSERSKQLIAAANKNKVPWNKGIPRTENEKQKIRLGLLNSKK